LTEKCFWFIRRGE